MKKIAYIIPGYSESHLVQKSYGKIAKFFLAKGITPVQVDINWDLKKPIDFEKHNQQFFKKFQKSNNSKIYVLGFSYGAMIALLTAAKTKPSELILCSLSPYFTEDYKIIKPQWLRWWKQNYKNDFSFKAIPVTRAKVYLIVGAKEHNSVQRRSRLARQQIGGPAVIKIKDAKHNLNHKEYLLGLEKLIQKF